MSSQKMLEGKVIVVTGSGSGVGRGIALEAARQGARVVVNDIGRTETGGATAQQVVDEIKAAGGEAAASSDNIAQWDGGHQLVQCALDNFGRVDAVVNNAGVLRDKIFHKMTEEDFD